MEAEGTKYMVKITPFNSEDITYRNCTSISIFKNDYSFVDDKGWTHVVNTHSVLIFSYKKMEEE